MSSSADPDSDNLRRSKRKKFKLDVVAAAHGNNQKKSKKDPHVGDDDDDEDDDFGFELSIDTGDVQEPYNDDDNGDEDAEEDTLSKRRTRRSTAHWGDYQESLMDFDDQPPGSFTCSKCPTSYESRSSLSNHTKMHNGEKRKFACELCDFSANTLKSLIHHNNIHKRFGVVSAQTSPAIVAESSSTTSASAPRLVKAEEEPYYMEEQEQEETSPPPILEREGSDDVPILERQEASGTVRKSSRPPKPSKKAATLIQKKGSLPSSSTSSSVTPPPKRATTPPPIPKAKRAPTPSPSPAQSPTPSPSPPRAKGVKRRLRCDHCPYSCTTITKMNKHDIGHDMVEGFLCPAKGCSFMCRRAGFIRRHFVLHKGIAVTEPKYVSYGEKEKAMLDKDRALEEKEKEKEKKNVSVKKTSEKLKIKKTLVKKKKTLVKAKVVKTAKIATVVVKKTKKIVKTKKRLVKKVMDKKNLIRKAQIKSHLKITTNDAILMRCNVAECDFQTTSTTQLIVHKNKMHNAKSVFPKVPFLCFQCGHRALTYAALRVHKLTRHPTTTKKTLNRFRRTYYLKEMVGDKFFIKYFIGSGDDPPDAEESGDESFDSLTGSSVSLEALSALNMEKKAVFCCNMCPYQAPTMNRCQRHHAKHFTNDAFKCAHCSWSSRSKEVIVAHEKLHLPSGVQDPKSEEPSTSSTSTPIKKEEKEEEKPLASEFFKNHPALGESLRRWCYREKSRQPNMDEQFTRKMIDGVKGFQCIDCPYTSKYRGDMRSHKKRHDIEQMYRCPQCTYTTNRPVSLKDHMKQHLPVNQETQPEKRVLVNHVNIGTRRGSARHRVYCCNKCPFATVTIGCLWRHHRNHRATAKINICSNCSYSSIDQRKMEEHTIIHTALGVNESVPFVKRVDHKGRPVSSLTDLNSDKIDRKANKRKILLDDSPQKSEENELKEPKPKREKKRKESSPPSSDSPGPSSHPTRLPSERATRNRINYSLMAKNGSGKPTPSTSSANLQLLAEDPENLEGQEDKEEEPLDVTHSKIRKFLNEEFAKKADHQCPECPFKSSEPEILDQHLFFHRPASRPYTCSDCSFNTFTPTALLQHLKLHTGGGYDPTTSSKRMKNRKIESIPPGAQVFYCRNCNFKTASKRLFADHSAYHRHILVNRINVTLKRQPPKEEYQRPKMRAPFVARNAKYCRKCTFKCVSQSQYVEHVDRHGWNQLYKCYICDYSDNSKSVVDFHQLNHHMVKDQTLHSIHTAAKFRLENGVIQKPETEDAKPSPEEFITKSRCLMKCPCCDYFCHVASELAFHMSVSHPNEPNVREQISYLHMGLQPPQTTVTTV